MTDSETRPSQLSGAFLLQHLFFCSPQRRGLYPPPPGESDIIGLEVAGTVDTLGPGVKRGWKPDDRVMALLCGGGYAEYVAVPEQLLMHAPPNLTLCQAAAIPEAWLTAFQLLVFVGKANIHAGQMFYATLTILTKQAVLNSWVSLPSVCSSGEGG